MKTTTKLCSQCGVAQPGVPFAYTLKLTAFRPIGQRRVALLRHFCSSACLFAYLGRPL